MQDELTKNTFAEVSRKRKFSQISTANDLVSTDNAATRKAKLCDVEAEMAPSIANCARLLQEKGHIERHNIWLNDELTKKDELCRASNEFVADMSSKLADAEKQYNQSLCALEPKEDRVKDPELQLSISGEFTSLQSQHEQLNASFDKRLSEIAQLQAEKRQTYSQLIEKDGEIERLYKSKRQLLELLEQKDIEISEKIVTMKSYLDKIDELTKITFAEVSRKRKFSQISTANDLVNSTDNAATRKAKLCDVEAELARSVANCTRLLQEKELIERRNIWLNDELTKQVKSLNELCRACNEFKVDMSSKLADAEKEYNQSLCALEPKQDRVKDPESQLTSLQEVNSTDNAATRKAKLCDAEAELARSVANCARLLQEKELIERHNIWLNDELTKQVKSFNELCRAHHEFEADMSSKLAEAEKGYNQSICALEPKQDRVKDPESQLTSLQEVSPLLDPGTNDIHHDAAAVFDQMIARLLKMKADCYYGKGLLPKVPTKRVVQFLDMPVQFLQANLKKPRSNLITRSNQEWGFAWDF